MSSKCEVCGKTPANGNRVSHAKNRTKRKFLPNLNNISLSSDMLGRSFQLRISTTALRTVNKLGGLDSFLAKAKPEYLSENALKIKKDIEKYQLEEGSS